MALLDNLIAHSAHPSIAGEVQLFGQFVGAWRVENSLLSESTGQWSHSVLRWEFAWVLDGRGVQDHLSDAAGASVGTTVRTWDPGGWRIVWFSPRSPEHCVLRVQRGHAGADANANANANKTDILPLGEQADGRLIRWTFSEISRRSFRRDGWCSNDRGETWWHEQHMDAVRAET